MEFGNVKGTQKPANQKLWDMLVQQAKHRFNVWPSLTASKWVHDQYVQEGGRFIAQDEEPDIRREPADEKRLKKEREQRRGPKKNVTKRVTKKMRDKTATQAGKLVKRGQ